MEKTKFIIFDLDGVFYKDDECIEGGSKVIEFLNKSSIDYCFLTNNSNYERSFYKKRLEKCGVIICESKIFTASMLLKEYVAENFSKNIYVLGSEHLKKTLYSVLPKSEINPEVLVLGMDDNITLKEISETINIVTEDTKIIASNPDKLIPKKDCFYLECGILIDIFKNFTGKNVKIIGKPSRFAFNYILKKFKLDSSEVIMVGDTYETDIVGGIKNNLKTVWINSGNSLPKDIDSEKFIKIQKLENLFKLIKL